MALYINFTLSATPDLNWRVLPLKERPTAQTGLPAARYGAAYFLRCTCDIATFGGLFTFSSKMYVPQGWSATMSVRPPACDTSCSTRKPCPCNRNFRQRA